MVQFKIWVTFSALVAVTFASKLPPCGVDKNEQCQRWAQTGECYKNAVWMMPNCAKSCSTCGPPTDKSCRDVTISCYGWSKKGECEKNKNWMHKNCAYACGLCGRHPPGTSGGGSQTGGEAIKPGGETVKPKPTPPTTKTCDTKGNPKGFWREMDMAIFVSPTLFKNWKSQHRKGYNDMKQRLSVNLKQEMDKLYSYDMLGGVDIKFNMVHVDTLSEPEAQWVVKKRNQFYGKERDAAGVAGFCDFQQMIRNRRKASWDIAMYLVDGDAGEGRFLTPGANGMTRTIEGICSFKKNWYCGIVHGRARHDNLVFDRLFAHETGHLVGFPHPAPGYCRNGMMTSPGTATKWSQCTIQKAKQIFSDPWKYPCMKYQCGEMPKPTVLPGAFSDADKEVLNQLCTRENNDGQKWELGAPKGAKGKPNSRYGIQTVLWENPNWWLEANVCKGIPCQAYSGTLNGITYMEGKPCGVRKTCRNKRCS